MTLTPADLPVGAFFLRHIEGLMGRTISAMQGFIRGGSFWTHAGLILDNGQYIQGQPHGAKIYFTADLLASPAPLLISDAPVQTHTPFIPSVRTCVAREGRRLENADYSYLDYPVLGIAELARLHPHNAFLNSVAVGLRHYINNCGHLICSALVDRGYLNAGIHLFEGHMPGDVTPEDLAEYAYADGRVPLLDTRENPK